MDTTSAYDDTDPPTDIYDGGDLYWRNDQGQLHRDNDKPAVVWADGKREWWTNGKKNRDHHKPAVIGADGRREWWIHGLLQPIPPDHPWTHTDHADWHDRDSHEDANQLLATFLMAYNRLIDAKQCPIHDAVTEGIFECGTWGDYTYPQLAQIASDTRTWWSHGFRHREDARPIDYPRIIGYASGGRWW